MRLVHALIALLPVLFSAPAGAQDHPLLKKGDSLYKQFCAHCHGIGMVNPGTSSFDLRKFPTDQKERFTTSVTKGYRSMPAWGDILLPEELEALWVYVATRGGKQPFPEQKADAPPAPAAAPELTKAGELAACLPSNGGAMSRRRHEGGAGLDYRVAAALAERLGLSARAVWYEAENEEESDPVREAYAMLAMGLCDIVPGHALYEPALGEPPGARAAPPRWADQPLHWRQGTQVDLVPITASRPYFRAEIGIALAPGEAGRSVETLADLAGTRLAIQEDTLSGALLQLQAPESVRAAAMTMPPGPTFLWRMENGEFDAGLVDVAAFDHHRIQNPVTRLALSPWRHPMAFNVGIAMRADRPALKAAIDQTIEALLAEGAVAHYAADEKVHYAVPAEPWIVPRLSLQALRAAR